MEFHFAKKGPLSLHSLRRSSGRKNTLRILVYLILLVISITSFLELKAIHRLLNQVHEQHTALNLKEAPCPLNSSLK